MLASKLAKACKPLSEDEALKEGTLETVEKISLSCRALTRLVELIDEDTASKLHKKAESFKLYSLALDESNDIKDTTYVYEQKFSVMNKARHRSTLANQKLRAPLRITTTKLNLGFDAMAKKGLFPLKLVVYSKMRFGKCHLRFIIISMTP